jgi:host factor-I protein
MAARTLSLQDHFLNSVRRAKLPVTIFLVKGVKLQGVITWFDSFSLLLRREGASQLVYKHSISTIMPSEPPPDFVATNSPALGAKAALQDLFLAAAARDTERMTLFSRAMSPASTSSASCSSAAGRSSSSTSMRSRRFSRRIRLI